MYVISNLAAALILHQGNIKASLTLASASARIVFEWLLWHIVTTIITMWDTCRRGLSSAKSAQS
jgi:hypothetical protein